MKVLIGLFLIAHGLVHASYISPKPPAGNETPTWPFDITKSWLLTPTGLSSAVIKYIGIILTIAIVIGFILSGIAWLGWLGLGSYWIIITTVSSILSIILLMFFWHSWLIIGLLIDLILLCGMYFKDFKPFE